MGLKHFDKEGKKQKIILKQTGKEFQIGKVRIVLIVMQTAGGF